MNELTVFTDGACKGNPGPGGFAAILFFGDRTVEIGGGELDTTNNRMELLGVIVALGMLKERTKVHIHSDSKYVCDGVSSWMHKWERNGWKLGGKTKKKHGKVRHTQPTKPVKNVDLWKQLFALTRKHDVKMTWVPGHKGNVRNEWADRVSVGMVGRSGGVNNLWIRDTPVKSSQTLQLSKVINL